MRRVGRGVQHAMANPERTRRLIAQLPRTRVNEMLREAGLPELRAELPLSQQVQVLDRLRRRFDN